ncbi:MAG: FKBP-type peptidyl-prolyl cis-trans isomerase [Coriobacteriales bacterium]|jgi:parvulin-like peptidyl-prolyl isomerase|nr:FKBP-type peptidyl-prolyl cis-trans isomerase [Coriobacteriales bacterium]
MKAIRTTLMTLVLTLCLCIGLIGCSQPADSASQVAATVNGVEILESDVTTRIESFRLDQNTGEPLNDVEWAKMLKSAEYTPETLREYVIRNQFAIFTLILQKAAEEGIEPDVAQIDQSIADTKTSVENSGETWEAYLQSMGYSSEAAYRQELEARGVSTQLIDKQTAESAPSQAEIDTYISENAAQYAGKRFSLIYLPYDAPTAGGAEGTEGDATTEGAEGAEGEGAEGDATTEGAEGAEGEGTESEATPEGDATTEGAEGENAEASATSEAAMRTKADEALAKLRDGADFSDVAKEYSQAGNVQSDGGDLGWGQMGALPNDVIAALDALPANEPSEVLQTDLGSEDSPAPAFMIVEWTEEFVIPEDAAAGPVDVASVPASLVETLTESFEEQEKSNAQQDYYQGLTESDEIVINPMPEGLPYAVDMSLADEPDSSEGEGTEGSETGELIKNDLVEGTGPEAKTGDKVSVHYTGYLDDGTVFDSSVERGTPYEVTLGEGAVIQGWDQGIPGMKVGGTRQLIIPPELAYGESGRDTIPPNATLTFDVELLSVNGDSTGAADSEVSSNETSSDADAETGEGAETGDETTSDESAGDGDASTGAATE